MTGKEITREELYDLVWQRPISKLAPETPPPKLGRPAFCRLNRWQAEEAQVVWGRGWRESLSFSRSVLWHDHSRPGQAAPTESNQRRADAFGSGTLHAL